MKAYLLAWTLPLVFFGSGICVAESRYVTLSVSGTNQTDQFILQDFEVAKLKSAHDRLVTFSLTVTNSHFSTYFLQADLQGGLTGSSSSMFHIPPKSIVIAGPATFTLTSGSALRDANDAYATFEILPETSSVNQTLIIPPGTNHVQITLESSTNLVSWSATTNGVYGSPDTARFFRINLQKLD